MWTCLFVKIYVFCNGNISLVNWQIVCKLNAKLWIQKWQNYLSVFPFSIINQSMSRFFGFFRAIRFENTTVCQNRKYPILKQNARPKSFWVMHISVIYYQIKCFYLAIDSMMSLAPLRSPLSTQRRNDLGNTNIVTVIEVWLRFKLEWAQELNSMFSLFMRSKDPFLRALHPWLYLKAWRSKRQAELQIKTFK